MQLHTWAVVLPSKSLLSPAHLLPDRHHSHISRVSLWGTILLGLATMNEVAHSVWPYTQVLFIVSNIPQLENILTRKQ